MLSACAPFVEMVKLDAAARAKARSDVKQYLPGEIPATAKVVQDLDATSCRLTLSDPPATNEDAIDQLRFKAARLGANGIMDVFCDSAGSFDLRKNCCCHCFPNPIPLTQITAIAVRSNFSLTMFSLRRSNRVAPPAL